MKIPQIALILLLLGPGPAAGALQVQPEASWQTGQKTVIRLKFMNTASQAVLSARARLFLTDASGRVIGQTTRWVIGGTPGKPSLAPDCSTSYHFVVDTGQAFATARLVFSRIVLEGGKQALPQPPQQWPASDLPGR